MPRGSRESSWLVLRRCLAIIRRVQRGPARWQDLVEAVRQAGEVDDPYGGAAGKALRKRVENDLRRIREALGVEIRYSREAGGYILHDLWVPLLDLPDEDLATLGWLRETFGPDTPQYEAVQGLVSRLCSFMDMERRFRVTEYRSTLAVDLQHRDDDTISQSIWDGLTRALEERRWIAFDYLSPHYSDGQPRRHIVAPVRRSFHPGRGHYYLYGWCKEIQRPVPTPVEQYIFYRLGRMSNLQILPNLLPPSLPSPPRYRVIYELAPEIARMGVTRPYEIRVLRTESRPDGSAVVYGEAESLFWAVQRLLEYGAGCRVLGGPQLLAEMRRTVREMARIYLSDEEEYPTVVGEGRG